MVAAWTAPVGSSSTASHFPLQQSLSLLTVHGSYDTCCHPCRYMIHHSSGHGRSTFAICRTSATCEQKHPGCSNVGMLQLTTSLHSNKHCAWHAPHAARCNVRTCGAALAPHRHRCAVNIYSTHRCWLVYHHATVCIGRQPVCRPLGADNHPCRLCIRPWHMTWPCPATMRTKQTPSAWDCASAASTTPTALAR
jgi:hypothetical protein